MLIAACVASTQAAELKVEIDDGHGHPVSDTVVTVLPQDPAAKLPPRHASAATSTTPIRPARSSARAAGR